jgi:hypothetical protein
MNRKTLLILVAGVGAMLALSCAYQPSPPPNAEKIPGFFRGLVQGFLIFFSLVLSFFKDVRIYEYPNSGLWYDVGYVLGASIFFGGSGAGAKSSRRKNR